MKKAAFKIQYIIAAFVLSLLSVFAGGLSLPASADISSIIAELSADPNFTVNDYPYIKGDCSLSLIQIGESAGGNLYLYVYQPGKDERANAQRVSFAECRDNEEELKPATYDLELVDFGGCLYKYRVCGYKVSSTFGADGHLYNIAMLQRAFIEGMDEPQVGDNITNYKSYKVGQFWTVTKEESGQLSYTMTYSDVVEIKNPYVGYVSTPVASAMEGTLFSTLYNKYAYYVAFTPGRPIDELLEADVEYEIRDYFYQSVQSHKVETPEDFAAQKVTKTVNCNESIDFIAAHKKWFNVSSEKFHWDRITDSATFIEQNPLTDEVIAQIRQRQWVLHFNETHMFDDYGLLDHIKTGQLIDKVTVLRLKFKYNGETYNLLTVSDTVSGKLPDGGSATSSSQNLVGIMACVVAGIEALGVVLTIIICKRGA